MVKKFLERDGTNWRLEQVTRGATGPVGPAGTNGIDGTIGPTGATGDTGGLTGEAGGDLLGTYPNPQVEQTTVPVFTFFGPEIVYTGGTGAGGGALATTDTNRFGLLTLDETPNQVLNAFIPDDGQIIRVLAEVHAVRIDAPGDAAWFLLKGVWLRIGGSLIIVRAPAMVDSGATGGATGWAAQLVAVGTTIQTQVTGGVESTIHWSLVREFVEGS